MGPLYDFFFGYPSQETPSSHPPANSQRIRILAHKSYSLIWHTSRVNSAGYRQCGRPSRPRDADAVQQIHSSRIGEVTLSFYDPQKWHYSFQVLLYHPQEAPPRIDGWGLSSPLWPSRTTSSLNNIDHLRAPPHDHSYFHIDRLISILQRLAFLFIRWGFKNNTNQNGTSSHSIGQGGAFNVERWGR